jgi:hypothetical protein
MGKAHSPNVPALIDGDACLCETEVIGIWTASHRQQDVWPDYLGIATGAVNLSENLLAALRKANTSCVQPNLDAGATLSR